MVQFLNQNSSGGGGGGTGDVTASGTLTSDKIILGAGSTSIKASTKGLTDYTEANVAITPATKTKITYDAKGLVTSGADATAADVGALALNQSSPQTVTGGSPVFAGGVSPDYIQMDITPTSTTSAAGKIVWNATDGTFDMGMLNSSVLQVGQEMYFYGKASGNIANGEVCQFAGAEGDHFLIKKAVPAEVIANPRLIMGVATNPITSGDFGYVTWFGKINGVYTKTPANGDTADWVAGDILYWNNTTGQLTKTQASAPNRDITMAAVIKVQTGASENGVIFIRPTFGQKMTELEDVDGTALTADGQIMVWDNTNKFFDATKNINNYMDKATYEPELDAKKPFHGVLARPVGVSNPLPTHITTNTFTLGATANPITYYYNGVKVVVSTDKQDTLDDGAGFYYIYFDGVTGNIVASKNFPGITLGSNVIIATVLWNGSDYGLVNDERHGYDRNGEWHLWAHTTVGARYRSGLTLTVNTGAETFNVTAGEIADEDIQFVISEQTEARLFYQTAADNYAFLTAPSATPGYLGANGRPNYVRSDTYALVQATSANNRFFNTFVYATTDLLRPIYMFTETVSAATATNNGYNNANAARAIPFPNLAALGLSPELKAIYRLIWRADGVLQAIDTTQDDYRTVSSLPMAAGNTSTTAGAVTFNPSGTIEATTVQTAIEELDSEVVHIAGTETITGAKTFNVDVTVPDEAYGAGWDNSLEVPTKNAVYDEMETKADTSALASYVPYSGGSSDVTFADANRLITTAAKTGSSGTGGMLTVRGGNSTNGSTTVYSGGIIEAKGGVYGSKGGDVNIRGGYHITGAGTDGDVYIQYDASATGNVIIGSAVSGTVTMKGTGITTSQILSTDGSSNITSLSTATYPSLAELAYVKGVTSAIQTQISGLVPKATYDANSILYATDDNTPVALTVGTNTVVGRVAGAITTLAVDSDLSSVSANDDTVPSAKATKAMGDLKLPLAGGTMTGNITLSENTSIALDPAGSADGKYSGITITGTAGATVAFGDLITLDKDDSRWELVDISVAAAATGDARGILGMAVSTGNDGDAITILLEGVIRADANFPTLTIGANVYASTTGDIVVAQPTTADHVIRIVGGALTADEIFFRPDYCWITHT